MTVLSTAASPPYGVSTFHALGRTPVPGPHPCGMDADGTPAFDMLMEEVGKLTQLDGPPVDWAVVVQQAALVLEAHSKDLRAAAYLVRGLFEQNGLQGLSIGLQVVLDLVSRHWEDCWPPLRRKRARVAALSWMSEKITPLVRVRFVDLDDKEFLRDIRGLVTALESSLFQALGEDAPDFTDLKSVLNDKEREASAAEARASERGSAGGYRSAANGASARSGSSAVSSLDPRSDRALKQIFTETATVLRPEDMGNPLYYHMVRYVTWRNIQDLPVAQNDGKTQLAPVPIDRVLQYRKLLANNQLADLLHQAEQSVARNPFWLDGHRLVENALHQLGYAEARAAVRYEVRVFLERLPGLVRLCFSDGSPFADAATVRWLSEDVLASGLSTAEEDAVLSQGGWRGILASVQTEGPGSSSEMLRQLERGLLSESEPRRRFLWGMALAQACLDLDHTALAEVQFSRLADQYAALGLSAWEPSLGSDLKAALSGLENRRAFVSQPVSGEEVPVLHHGER